MTVLSRQIGTVWGVQVVAAAAQLVYAALTSRLLDASAFGSYAAALAAASAVAIMINSGLGAAAARRQEDGEQGDRALVTMAWGVGALAALGLFVLADPVARLWQQPATASLLRIMAVALLVWPFTAVTAGILRRQGRIAAFNWVTLGAVLVALAISAALVMLTRSAWSLTVAQVGNAVLTALGFALALGRRARPGRMDLRGPDALYALKYTVLATGAVINNVVPLWAVSRFCGADTLGNWNRAQALGRTPIDGLIRAGITVVFPHFRFDRPKDARTVQLWTTLNASVAWFVVPVGVVLTPAMGPALLFLFGDTWQTAAQIIGYLWIGGVLLILSSVLATALESAGAMRIAGWGRLTSVVIIVSAAAVTAASGSWLPVAVGMAVSQAAVQVVQVVLAAAAGYLRAGFLAGWYCAALIVGLLLAGAVAGFAALAVPVVPVALLLAAAYTAGALAARRVIGPLRGHALGSPL